MSSPALQATARLTSSYLLSIYKVFAPLPSLTTEDLNRIRTSYCSDLANAILPRPTKITTGPSFFKALGRFLSFLTFTIYTLFVTLPSLTSEHMASIRSAYTADLYNALVRSVTPSSVSGPGVLKALGRLLAFYTMSIYAMFGTLPSLAGEPMAQLRSTYTTDLVNAVLRISAAIYSAAHNFIAHPSSPESIIPWMPKSVKYVLLGLLLINSRSFPFIWHIRVWRPLYWLVSRLILNLHMGPTYIINGWDEISPIGLNPLDEEAVWNSWASPDECSWNLKFNNSSYAKNWDSARFKDIMNLYNRLLIDGGRLAIAGTHFNFVKPISIFDRYSIKSRIVAWDDKWIYNVAEFVTESKKTDQETKPSASISAAENNRPFKEHSDLLWDSSLEKAWSEEDQRMRELSHEKVDFDMPLRSPLPQFISNAEDTVDDVHGPSSDASTPSLCMSSSASDDGSEFDVQLNENTFSFPSPSSPSTVFASKSQDGRTLHCVAMSRTCWKIGRITIPPALALASAGWGLDKDQWAHVSKMRYSWKMPAFLRGGWKKVPREERWWEQALGKPEIEERRKRNMEIINSMREGLEGAFGI